MEISYTRQPTVTTDKNGYTEDQQTQYITRTAKELVKKERKVQEETLSQDKNWIDSAKILYQMQEDAEGELPPDEELSTWALDYVGQIQYNLVSGANAALEFQDADDMQKIAMRYAMETYDMKDITAAGAMRFAKGLATDPTTYIGLGSFGVGFGAKAAASQGAKKAFMQFLSKPANLAAVEGAMYGAAESGVQQNIEVATVARDEVDLGEVAMTAGIGAVAGKTLGEGIEYLGKKFSKAEVEEVQQEGQVIAQDIQANIGFAPELLGGSVNGLNYDEETGEFTFDPIRFMEGFLGGHVLKKIATNPKLNAKAKKEAMAYAQRTYDKLKDKPMFKYLTGSHSVVDDAPGVAKSAPDFYSTLENVLSQTSQKKWNSEQLKGYLEKKGVKAEELKWSGINDYLANNSKVTTEEVLANIKQPKLGKTTLGYETLLNKDSKYFSDDLNNKMSEAISEFSETEEAIYNDIAEFFMDNPAEVKKLQNKFPELKDQDEYELAYDLAEDLTSESSKDVSTKYAEYTTKNIGGKNYREELTTLDGTTTEEYKSSHWDDSNVLYHVRKQDTKIDGDDTLLIEEIQSDWHQEGRKKGYKGSDTIEALQDEWKVYNKALREKYGVETDKEMKYKLDEEGLFDDYIDKRKAMQERKEAIQGGVPQAPYSKTWHEKAMKDQIAEAAKNGQDRIAWVAGKEQAERYSLSKQIDELEVEEAPLKDGTFDVWISKNGEKDYLGNKTKQELSDTIGKDMAQKVIDDNGGVYEGLDLEVGGEGMKGFYDKMLPKWTDKYIKKFGSKVETKTLPNGQEVWSFSITDKMKKDVKNKGQAMYSVGAGAAGMGAVAATQQDEGL